NQVQVPSVVRNGMTYFKVTADGRVMVPASRVVDATLTLAARTNASPPRSSPGVIKQVSYTTQTTPIPVNPKNAAPPAASPNQGAAQPKTPESVPANAPLPLTPVPKAETAKASVPERDGAYVTTGVILVSAEEPAAPTPVASKNGVSPAQLKKRI